MPPRAPAMPPDERRHAIVEATLPLLLERGAAVSTREIARAAGVAEGTIFSVFPSKDAVFEAVATSVFDEQKLIDGLAAVDRTLPLELRLVAAIDVLRADLEKILGVMMHLRALGFPQHRDHEEARQNSERRDARIDAALTDVIGPDVTAFRVDPEALIPHIKSSTFASAAPWIPGRKLTSTEVVDLLLHGALALRGAPAESTPDVARGTSAEAPHDYIGVDELERVH